MTEPDPMLLPAWVIGDQPDETDAHLQQAAEADPSLEALATSLRSTQLRAMAVIGRDDTPQVSPPMARPSSASAVREEPEAAVQKPGRKALLVALIPGVIAVLLAVVVLSTLSLRNQEEPPAPVTEQLTLVIDGSLAPLALQDPELASRSLIALGVPQRAATPPDLTRLDMTFLRATALPGQQPGAAFEYQYADTVVLVQTARTLTAPTGSDIRPYKGTPVYWASVGSRTFAVWPESGVYRAMSIDGPQDDLRVLVHAWLDLPGVL